MMFERIDGPECPNKRCGCQDTRVIRTEVINGRRVIAGTSEFELLRHRREFRICNHCGQRWIQTYPWEPVVEEIDADPVEVIPESRDPAMCPRCRGYNTKVTTTLSAKGIQYHRCRDCYGSVSDPAVAREIGNYKTPYRKAGKHGKAKEQ